LMIDLQTLSRRIIFKMNVQLKSKGEIMKYYFVLQDGSVVFAKTYVELKDKIKQYTESN
jgi:hypothetical protein